MENQKILLSSTGEFGDRIRSICGALLLSYMSGRKLHVMWDKEEVDHNDVKIGSLYEYFSSIKDCQVLEDKLIPDVCYSEYLPGDDLYNKQNSAQTKLSPIKTIRYNSTLDIINDNSNVILLETSYVMKSENTDEKLWKTILTSIYKNNFKINDKYEFILNITKFDVGISIKKSDQSLEDISSWIIKSFKGLNVVIFSDDHTFRDKIRQITNCTSDPIINDLLWEKEFTEFLILSNCSKVYGSKLYSFVEEAALFDDKPYDIILSEIIGRFEQESKNNDLYDLGVKYATDKITHHGYHRFYDKFLKSYRHEENMGMIEIGIDQYKSLYMWLDYFPKAFIYGIDIDKSLRGDRYLVYKADQNDIFELNKLKYLIDISNRNILFICDDGSHFPVHIYNTFNFMFKNILKEGGIYIIEDIETSYWKKGSCYGNNFEYGYHHKQSVIEVFKMIIDDINGEFLNTEEKNMQKINVIDEDVKSMISTITFCHNSIIIVKKTDDENKYLNRKYRFESFIA